ncbi:hypothetical protein D3C87_782580 [compost metagenome]
MGFGFQPRKMRTQAGDITAITAKEATPSVTPSTQHATGRGFLGSGPVRGPGHGTSDSIAARVPSGSFVMPADSTAQIGDEALASMGPRGFMSARQRAAAAQRGGVPVHLSNGEHLLSPRQVHAVGVQALEAMKDATHTPAQNSRAQSFDANDPRYFFADGGEVGSLRSTSNVTRVGNSYSGGNISGALTINGEAPRGTNSVVDPYSTPSAPAAPPAGRTVAVTIATPGAAAPPAPSPIAAGPGIIDSSAQRQQFFDRATAGTAAAQSFGAGRAPVAPAPAQGLGFRPRSFQQPLVGMPDAPAQEGFGFQPRPMRGTPDSDPRGFADGGLTTEEEIARRARTGMAASNEMIGRNPAKNMGPTIEVPRPNLPPPAGTPALTGAASSIAPRTQIAEVPPGMGQHPAKFMGAADVVQSERLATPPAASGAAAGARGFLPAMRRAAGPAAASLGVAMEGQQVLDVARDPTSSGLDVAAQAAKGVGRMASAGAGAAGGAALGAMTGPLAPAGVPLGAVAGGALGYWSADKAIQGGGALTEAAMRASSAPPADVSNDYPASGGAAFGVFPQMPRGGTDARPAPVQAQVRAVDNSPANAAALASAPTQSSPPPVPPAVQPAPALFGGGPASDPNDRVGLVGAAGMGSADRVAQMQRDSQHLAEMQQLQRQADQTQGMTSGTPGMVVIDNPGPTAAQAMFDSANLRTAAARGGWSPRRGFQGDEDAVRAAALPVQQRAVAEQARMEQAGATQRAQLQEQGLNSRERMTATQRGQATEIAGRRLAIEEAQESRAAAEAGQAQRLRDLVVNGNPLQRRLAAARLAALQGKGLEGAGKPLTEGQSKALLFGSRMQVANETLASLQADGKVFSTPGANTPYVRGVVNPLNSEQGQQLDQAKRDFLNAVLRRESGAVIADSEFDNGSRQYFPQVGDGPKVIAQKARNREIAMRGILAEVPDSDTRIAELRTSMAPSPQQAAEQAVPPQLTELRRRAANNPQLAERLRAAGY